MKRNGINEPLIHTINTYLFLADYRWMDFKISLAGFTEATDMVFLVNTGTWVSMEILSTTKRNKD